MFNQDERKTECAVGNREMGFWQGKKAEKPAKTFFHISKYFLKIFKCFLYNFFPLKTIAEIKKIFAEILFTKTYENMYAIVENSLGKAFKIW